MLKSQQRFNAPLEGQTEYWNSWNAQYRESSQDNVSVEQSKVILSWLQRLGNNLTIVDVGCGTGWMAEKLLQFGKVTGTDLSDQVLARAALKYPGVRFVAGDFMSLHFTPSFYDVAVTMEVLSCVADPSAFLGKIADMLHNGGYLMLATQNKPALERNDIRPPGEHQIRRWLNRGEVRQLVSERFEITEMFSITPQFNHGWRRYVNSERLKRAFVRFHLGSVNGAIKGIQERAWCGWSIMVLARKR